MPQNSKNLVLFAAILAALAGSFFIVDTKENGPIVDKPPLDPAVSAAALPGVIKIPSDQTSKQPTPGFQKTNRTLQKPVSLRSIDMSAGAKRYADRILTRNGQVFPLRKYRPLINPNDTYANQWWVASNGMPAVWDMPAGARPSKIAVIDTGFALNHQEFSGRWAANVSETGPVASQNPSKLNCAAQNKALDKSCNNIDDDFDGVLDNELGIASRQNPSRLNCTDQGKTLDKSCNQLDDDGNGLADDLRGWDFSNFDGNVSAGETNPDGSGTTHGTMVAGILGATGNNGAGIAGVNWHASILPLQALDDDSYGDSYTVAEAIYYAADQGVDVISISLGTEAEDPYLRYAIEYALDKGSLVVAASGNDGCNCISYPANYPEVIAVGAVDSTNKPASFSSYGARLDILAPGASMTSSTWTKANQNNAYAGNIAGTSFAAPFISGLLGLARSHQPDAKWEEITGAMFENGDRLSLSAATPRSDQLGFGAAKANTMLERLIKPYQPSILYRFAPVLAGSSHLYQCENTIPATMLFELNKAGGRRYTASPFERHKALQQGWSTKELMYTCIGLPTDRADLLRIIDLPREINNVHLKQ